MWQIFAIAGVVMFIIEILTPTMFFLNIAIACFITAVCSVYIREWDILIYILVGSSLVLLAFLYPWLVKNNKKKKIETGIGKYIGQKAKVTEKVTKISGAISVFDERWNARIEDGKEIAVGEVVDIYKNEGLTMFVRRGE
ncbi:MAG: NfeD family protein [Lactobacillus sp.]|nr:NfeD family protein [Lactobacillus sp.]